MKYCPNCQTTYTDDTLRFCLQDGTPLVEVADSDSQMPTVAFEAETQVSPKSREPIRVELPGIESYRREPVQEEQVTVDHFKPKKSNTALVVLLTAFIMLLLFGGGIGAWLFLRNGKNGVAQTTNNKGAANQNANPKNDSKDTKSEASPSPTDSLKDSTPSPTPSATASPSPDFNPEKIKNEVSDKVYSWASATESLNWNTLANYYADTVNYYNKNGVSSAYIRNDKQRAFDRYDNVEMNISNLRVTPDASGNSATAVFDKEWTFEGEDTYSSGKVQSQLDLKKISGRWLITGEKDLKVYYVNK